MESYSPLHTVHHDDYFQSGSSSTDISPNFDRSTKGSNKTITCHVSFANNSVKQIEILRNSKGEDCFHKVCKLIGIIEEAEYFGLQYRNCHGDILWLNLRNRLSKQIPRNPPFSLHFRVKFYVEPYRLQLESTRHQFFLNVALQIKKGFWTKNASIDLFGELLGYIARVEFNKFNSTTSPCKYSCLWPDNAGEIPMDLVGIIAQNHEKCHNQSVTAVEYLLCARAAEELEMFGIIFYDVKNMNFHRNLFGVSPNGVYLCSPEGTINNFYPFCRIHRVTDGSKTVYLNLYQDDGTLQSVGYQLSAKDTATSLYRCIIETRLFNHSPTIDQCYLEEMTKPLFFGGLRSNHAERDYIYDIRMTKREVLDQARRKLRKTSNQCRRTHERMHQSESMDNADDGFYRTVASFRSAQRDILSGSYFDIANVKVSERKRTMRTMSETRFPPTALGPIESFASPFDSLSSKTSSYPTGASPAVRLQSHLHTPPNEDMADLVTELERWNDAILCRICMDKISCRIFLPCGHAMTCEDCSQRFTDCPVCRQPITNVHVFYAPWSIGEEGLFSTAAVYSNPENQALETSTTVSERQQPNRKSYPTTSSTSVSEDRILQSLDDDLGTATKKFNGFPASSPPPLLLQTDDLDNYWLCRSDPSDAAVCLTDDGVEIFSDDRQEHEVIGEINDKRKN